MADTQILATQVLATPGDYKVKSPSEITIGSIFATFDGTAAGGSFVPTVEIVSDSGNTILEVPQDSTITAGDTVKATWAPFLRTAKAGPPGPPGGTIAAIHLWDTTGTLVPSANDQPLTFGNVSAFDSTVFTTHVTAGRVDEVILHKQGVYAVFGWMNWTDSGEYSTWLYNLAPAGPNVTPMMMGITKDVGALSGMFPTISYTRTFPAALAGDTNPSTLQFWIGQDSGVNKTTLQVYWDFQYLGATDH